MRLSGTLNDIMLKLILTLVCLYRPTLATNYTNYYFITCSLISLYCNVYTIAQTYNI